MPGVSVSGVSGDGEGSRRPSPGSTTMEDVLDSLLGLASSTSRSPSPSVAHRSCSDLTNHLAVSASNRTTDNEPIYAEVRRHSDCNASDVSPQTQNCTNRPQTQNYASSGNAADNEPIYAEVRRHSDCNDGGRGRRVSFDMAVAEGEIVRCRYNKCNRTASLSEAKKTYKTCHNCTHVYCSRECRRAHWEKHRKTCLHSRVGALCRKVMSNIKEDEEALQHVSLIARRGYLSKGRGAVKVLFCRPKNAEDFIAEGKARLGEPSYVKWTDLQTDEIGKEMYDELVRLCKVYNPDTRLVLYVVVCVVSEVPSTGGAVKWEMQMVSRCAKLKLAAGLQAAGESQAEPETLILTSLPGARDQGTRKARQISFTNIQRHLRQRGISLRKQFPEVYQRLCAYVEGTERFVPVTIYPRDVASGKNFMCIIMPDAEPEKLELIPKNSDRVQTIDVSVDPDSTV
ncbi:chromosome 9 open reading frame 172 [Nesidiocoris tenuis]|uniref:Chromosome 9 open reading frame 172 n=1 Tax=Nesidiocoris tenuis TaxID=355587 RepID=A0ABN7BAJ2_9HEMI|nr:chromosome 9 open reading frame 172 [Nesidiocoris tenuis]